MDNERDEVAEAGCDEDMQFGIVPMLQNVTDECQVYMLHCYSKAESLGNLWGLPERYYYRQDGVA